MPKNVYIVVHFFRKVVSNLSKVCGFLKGSYRTAWFSVEFFSRLSIDVDIPINYIENKPLAFGKPVFRPNPFLANTKRFCSSLRSVPTNLFAYQFITFHSITSVFIWSVYVCFPSCTFFFHLIIFEIVILNSSNGSYELCRLFTNSYNWCN